MWRFIAILPLLVSCATHPMPNWTVATDGLAFRARTDRESIPAGEKPRIHLEFKNDSDRPMWVRPARVRAIIVKEAVPAGEPLEVTGMGLPMDVEVKPGVPIVFVWNPQELLKAGTYTIQVTYALDLTEANLKGPATWWFGILRMAPWVVHVR